MEPFSRTSPQKVLEFTRPIDRCPILNQEQFVGDFPQQEAQEACDILCYIGLLLYLHEQPSEQGNRADRREMITGQFHTQHRRLSNGP